MKKIEKTLLRTVHAYFCAHELCGGIRLNTLQWKKLYSLSLRQGVGALVYEQLQKTGNNMPEKLSEEWKNYGKFARMRFDAQLLSLNHLAAVLSCENIKLMVLKGLGLALTYPEPELRECSDIDIYCFDDFDKVNSLVVRSGLCKEAVDTEEKHFGFVVDGIEVENHRKFANDCNRANTIVGKRLMEMSGTEHITDERLPGLLFPSPTMGLLHLFMHTLSHLAWSGINLRQICDIMSYIRHYKDKLDWEIINIVLTEAGIYDSAMALIRLCKNIMLLSLGHNTFDKETRTILRSILHPLKPSQDVRDPLRKFHRKLRQYRHRRTLHPLVYHESFPESFLHSFVCLRKYL